MTIADPARNCFNDISQTGDGHLQNIYLNENDNPGAVISLGPGLAIAYKVKSWELFNF